MASLSRVVPAGENLPVKESERSGNATKALQQSQVVSQQNGMTPAPAPEVHDVFRTTELIEMILLQDNIPLTQLFVLQRVSKKIRDVIVGSQQLKLKMFLTYDTKVPYPSTKQELEQLIKDNSAPFFNPLMLVSPTPDKALVHIPIFRHVLLLIPIGMMQDMRIWILAEDALQGAVNEELEPHQGGSWEKMKLCRAVPTLKFYDTDRQFGCHSFSLTGEYATMGNVVHRLRAVLADNISDTSVRWLRIDMCFDRSLLKGAGKKT